jgi:acetoin utilization deacetylase AcuC-like enzyme
VTRAPARAAVSAAKSPAAPAPTTTRSLGGSCTAGTVPGVPPWFRHDAGLAHDVPGHPERPARIVALEAEMERHGWFGWERVEAPRATRDQLSRVHPPSHVDSIAELSARGGGRIDMDTSVVEGTYEAALRAAGGAVALVDALLVDGEPCGVSALRPPGHHAEAARAMGFCFFNNVAVAAAHARTAHGVERVLIVDWDVHHGNGTNDIFHADPSVLFCSIHEWPLYPGTGRASDVGYGAGEGFTVNLPVPGGSGDPVHGSLVEHVVAPLIRGWEPELVLISAGFDAHRADPLATCELTEAGFAGMTASLRRAGADGGAPLGLVLEGGYAVEALAASMAAVVPVLGAAAVPEPAVLDVHPLTLEARERLAAWWPAQFGSMRRM